MNIEQINKRHPKTVLLALACVTFLAVAAALSQASAPFSFNLFQTDDAIMAELRKRLPENPTQEQVEQLIVTEGGATKKSHDWRPNYFHYWIKRSNPVGPNDSWGVSAIYYQDGTVRQLKIGSQRLYADGPPSNRSDITVFDLSDYEDPDLLMDTMRTLFPLESPRAELEKVLVDWSRATVLHDPNRPTQVIYRHKHGYSHRLPDGKFNSGDWVWTLAVSYRQDDTIMQIMLDGSKEVSAFHPDREYWLRTHTIVKGKRK